MASLHVLCRHLWRQLSLAASTPAYLREWRKKARLLRFSSAVCVHSGERGVGGGGLCAQSRVAKALARHVPGLSRYRGVGSGFAVDAPPWGFDSPFGGKGHLLGLRPRWRRGHSGGLSRWWSTRSGPCARGCALPTRDSIHIEQWRTEAPSHPYTGMRPPADVRIGIPGYPYGMIGLPCPAPWKGSGGGESATTNVATSKEAASKHALWPDAKTAPLPPSARIWISGASQVLIEWWHTRSARLRRRWSPAILQVRAD